jgi:hypothetical protein
MKLWADWLADNPRDHARCPGLTVEQFCQAPLLPYNPYMSQQLDAQLSNQEGRIQLALSAYNSHQIRSLQRAAKAFNVPLTTLSRQYKGDTHCPETRHA